MNKIEKPQVEKFKFKEFKLKEWMIGALVIIVIFGGIGMTKLLGIWTTESSKIPNKISTGVNAGEYDPFDIRGSYTFGEVSNLYDIDIAYLAEAFQLGSSEEAASMKTKDLETIFEQSEVEVGNSSVQVFVALMKSIDVTGMEAYLPASAVNVLSTNGPMLDDASLAYIESHTIGKGQLSADLAQENPVEGSEAISSGEGENESQVNGTSTFAQVLAMGISEADIMKIIEDDMPPTNQKVRDYCTEKGLPFSEVKQALNDLLAP
ncbi:hypothetical protein [Fusibacter bizertensis]